MTAGNERRSRYAGRRTEQYPHGAEEFKRCQAPNRHRVKHVGTAADMYSITTWIPLGEPLGERRRFERVAF